MTSPQPVVVEDAAGNLWRHYNDVGWVLLITVARAKVAAAPTLADLEARVGPVTEWKRA